MFIFSKEVFKCFHFVGVSGIGMSGLAKLLKELGFKVQGSDLQPCEQLKNMGVPVYSHHESPLEHVNAVVVSSAVKSNNPVVEKAHAKGIPVIHRSLLLQEFLRLKKSVAVCGTHGKTTTTSLLGHVLSECLFSPTIINGGVMENYTTNAVLGRGDWVVVEADESDQSFLNLKPIVSIVTNIDAEHMESYESFDNVKQSFLKFLDTPFHGVGIGCFDHDVVKDLLNQKEFPTISYGLTGGDLEADAIRFTSTGMIFNVKNHIFPKLPSFIEDMFVPLMGLHNVQNALAVMAFCMWIGIDDYRIQQAFKTFKGVKRRFNILKNSKNLVIIDDYAHHPVEIHAVIDAARRLHPDRRLVCVWEPHRYSRLSYLMDDFKSALGKADLTLVTPIYSAGEKNIHHLHQDHVIQLIVGSCYIDTVSHIQSHIQNGDVLLFMGAGHITKWAHELSKDI